MHGNAYSLLFKFRNLYPERNNTVKTQKNARNFHRADIAWSKGKYLKMYKSPFASVSPQLYKQYHIKSSVERGAEVVNAMAIKEQSFR